MIKINLASPGPGGYVTVASLVLDDCLQLELSGPQAETMRPESWSLPLETGERLTRDSNPIMWMRSLPMILRTPYLVPETVADTFPQDKNRAPYED